MRARALPGFVVAALLVAVPPAARPAPAATGLGFSQILSVAVAGGAPVNLSRSLSGDYSPAPSPDGRSIAFVREDASGDLAVWTMRTDGSGQRRVVAGDRPVWAPDGMTISYDFFAARACPGATLRCGFVNEVRAIDVATGAVRIVAQDARGASWAPTGMRVAYEGALDRDGASGGIYVGKTDGGDGVTTRAAAGTAPTWSPDGRWIAYTSSRGVARVRPDGTGARRIASGSLPRWSPDGRYLAFVRAGRTGRQATWVVRFDGRGARAVGPGGSSPAWSPDGRRLAYVSRRGILVVARDGSGRRLVAATDGLAHGLSWSPDGRRLIYAARAVGL